PVWSPPAYRPQTAKSSADEAKWWLVVAAIAAVALVFTEGLRYDGYVQLNPMHPIHLFGANGEWTWGPLRQLDQEATSWGGEAFIRPWEGPWTELERAPLDRVGFTYNLLLGTGEVTGAEGTRRAGFLSHIELGYFPHQMFGILLDIGLGWRTDSTFNDIFQSRWALEFQALPLVARPIHGGLWAEIGGATRPEGFNYPGVTGAHSPAPFPLAGGGVCPRQLTPRPALGGAPPVPLLSA